MTRSWQADAVGPPPKSVAMLVAEWRAENAGLRAAWEQAVAERDAAKAAERDMRKRLWPYPEFGPQSFDEIETFIEEERRCDVEMRETKAARIAELEAHVAALQEKINAETSCACSYDDKDDVCMGHSPKLAEAIARAEKAEMWGSIHQERFDLTVLRAEKAEAEARRLSDAHLHQIARAEKAEAENWQLRQACGYSIPADKETPQNPFKCGTCEASHIRAEKAEAALKKIRAIINLSSAGETDVTKAINAALKEQGK